MEKHVNMWHPKLARWFACLVTSFALSVPVLAADTGRLSLTKEINPFVKQMVARHGFNRDELTALLKQAEVQPKILAAMTRPAEKSKPWYEYREIFLKSERIEEGTIFWRQHEKTLKAAEKRFGVPASIIVAIIGVETYYGERKGSIRVIDALATLGFRFPSRASFFKKELEHFLLLCRDIDLDPSEVEGSYAGAMGIPQFIPSSYRAYAVDFDGNKKPNLLDSPVDAIGSVGNYLKKNGWAKGGDIVVPVKVSGESHKRILEKSRKPDTKLAELSKYGVKLTTKADSTTKGSLFRLKKRNGHAYFVGLQNFYSITRYNPNRMYAMAVVELAREITKRRASAN